MYNTVNVGGNTFRSGTISNVFLQNNFLFATFHLLIDDIL